MIPLTNPWAPAFTRMSGLGQMTPLVNPSSVAPSVSPAGGAATAALAIGASVAVLAVSSLSVLFSYGVAKESKSSLVKTTGYVIAGLGAAFALVEAGTVAVMIAKSA